MLRLALLFLVVSCGPSFRYTAFDATKAQAIAIQATVTIEGAIAFCGPTVALPPVSVTMVDGKQRATANIAQDSLLDGNELVWSASLGQVRHDPTANRDVFDATTDYWRLLDEDVTVTVALAKNRAVTASITLLPTYVCQQVANFSGQFGQGGYSGESGSPGAPQRHGGAGRDGQLGGPGGPGPEVVADLTVAGTKKRGKLVFARVGGQAFVFAEKGGSLVVVAAGGQGGAGGRGGSGGGGGGGGVRDNTCLQPGDGGAGGRGGDGGDGGDGGSVLVRVDRAYPHLADLVQVSVEGGRGGEPGAAGEGGRGGYPEGSITDGSGSSTSCSSKLSRGQDGQYGQEGQRPGRNGRQGRTAVKLESLTTLFPEGVNLIDRGGATTTKP
jgi:hypothetical protein